MLDKVLEGVKNGKKSNDERRKRSRNKGRLSIDDMVFGTRTGMSENQFYITNYGKTSA